jgi:hypothetical protein
MSLQYAFLRELPKTNETFETKYYNKICALFEKTFPKLKSKNLIKQNENCMMTNGCIYYLYKDGVNIYMYNFIEQIWFEKTYEECKDILRTPQVSFPSKKTLYLFEEKDIENLLENIEKRKTRFPCIKKYFCCFA